MTSFNLAQKIIVLQVAGWVHEVKPLPTWQTTTIFLKTGNYHVMFVIIFWIQSEFFAEILPQIEKVTRKKTDICFQQIMVSNVFYTALLRHVIYIPLCYGFLEEKSMSFFYSKLALLEMLR